MERIPLDKQGNCVFKKHQFTIKVEPKDQRKRKIYQYQAISIKIIIFLFSLDIPMTPELLKCTIYMTSTDYMEEFYVWFPTEQPKDDSEEENYNKLTDQEENSSRTSQ